VATDEEKGEIQKEKIQNKFEIQNSKPYNFSVSSAISSDLLNF